MAGPNLSLSHYPIGRHHDPRVVEVDPSQLDRRLPCAHIRLELYLLSIQHRHLPALRLHLGLAAAQRRPQAFFIRHRLLELLVCARPRFLQLLFADSFEPGAFNIGTGRLDVGLSLRDLAGLQLFLSVVVFQRGLCREHAGLGLLHLRAKIIVFDLHEEITGLDLLVVLDRDHRHNARDLGAQRRDIGPDIGIVCRLC